MKIHYYIFGLCVCILLATTFTIIIKNKEPTRKEILTESRLLEPQINYTPEVDDPLVIEKPNRDLNITVKRRIDMNSTHICIKSENINKCDSINNISEYTQIEYDTNQPYTVIFEMNDPKSIYIINENEKTNPNVITYGSGFYHK